MFKRHYSVFLMSKLKLSTFFLSKFLLCSTILSFATTDSEYDYTKNNYCTLPECEGGGQPIGCSKDCTNNTDIKEYTDNITNFRKLMLDQHNHFRQYLASGNEKNKSLGTSSNMNALSYSLELEHLSRCWIHNARYGLSGLNNHPPCIVAITLDKTYCGQNLAFSSMENMPGSDKELTSIIQKWYDEILFLGNNSIDPLVSLYGENEEEIGHFTAVVWATATHLGCARGSKKNPLATSDNDSWSNAALVCNYASNLGTNQVVNKLGEAVYLQGPACSNCSNGRSCNKQYNSLCGDIEAIPSEKVKMLPEAENATEESSFRKVNITFFGAEQPSSVSQLRISSITKFIVTCVLWNVLKGIIVYFSPVIIYPVMTYILAEFFPSRYPYSINLIQVFSTYFPILTFIINDR